MDSQPDSSGPSTGGKKRIMGGKPVLPKVFGRPAPGAPGTGEPGGEWAEVDPNSGWEEAGDPTAPLNGAGAAGPVDDAAWTPVVQGVQLSAEAAAGGFQFEHACCKAVRPNPLDPDPSGAVRDVRPEPYLTWQGPLKPTARFGLALLGVGLVAILGTTLGLLGVTFGMFVLFGIAAVGLIFLVVSFFLTNSAVKNIELRAVRHVIEPKIERGKLFHATLDTTGTTVPGLVKVRITDQHAPGLRPVERPVLDGAGRIHYRVRPQGRGLISFSGLDVEAEDIMGLWVAEQEWRLRTTVEVDASLPAIAWKARVTGYAPFDNSTPQAIVKLYRDVEYEDTRPFAAGDRIKDVMWKRMAIDGQMIVRKRSTDPDTTLLLTIDCGKSMLQDQAGFRNLDLGIEIAQEFAAAALARNHETGILAYNEERIVDHVRPTRSKIQLRKIITHFQQIADHHLPEEGEDPNDPMRRVVIAGDPENLRLGFGYALRQRSTSAMTLIVFSDLQTTAEAIVQSIAKAASSGQRVVVMLLPGPKLKAVRTGPRDVDAEESELRGEHHTNRMRELLIANGCEFIEVNPTEDDFKLDVPMPDEKTQRKSAETAAKAAAKAALARSTAPRAAPPNTPRPAGARPGPKAPAAKPPGK